MQILESIDELIDIVYSEEQLAVLLFILGAGAGAYTSRKVNQHFMYQQFSKTYQVEDKWNPIGGGAVKEFVEMSRDPNVPKKQAVRFLEDKLRKVGTLKQFKKDLNKHKTILSQKLPVESAELLRTFLGEN
jgi:hypothetical protein